MHWIALVDDLLFKGRLLEYDPGTKIVSNQNQLMETIQQHTTAGIVLDLEFRGTKPVQLIQQIKKNFPNARIIAYCSHAKKDLAIQAKEAGAEIVVSRASFVKNLKQWLR